MVSLTFQKNTTIYKVLFRLPLISCIRLGFVLLPAWRTVHSSPLTVSLLLWPLCSGVRQAVVEDAVLHATGLGPVRAQGRARLQEEPVVGQRAQRHQDTPRTGHQGQRLHEEAARVPAADGGPVRVPVPDERLQGAGQLDRDHQLRVRCLLRSSAGRRRRQSEAVPATTVAHLQDQVASGGWMRGR